MKQATSDCLFLLSNFDERILVRLAAVEMRFSEIRILEFSLALLLLTTMSYIETRILGFIFNIKIIDSKTHVGWKFQDYYRVYSYLL